MLILNKRIWTEAGFDDMLLPEQKLYIPDHVDPPFLFMLTHHSCMLTQGENIFLVEFIPAC
jgi:hypothetical protein